MAPEQSRTSPLLENVGVNNNTMPPTPSSSNPNGREYCLSKANPVDNPKSIHTTNHGQIGGANAEEPDVLNKTARIPTSAPPTAAEPFQSVQSKIAGIMTSNRLQEIAAAQRERYQQATAQKQAQQQVQSRLKAEESNVLYQTA
jgi:hypothetical protein